MDEIVELLRLPAVAPKPQAIAFDGERLWIGSRETLRLYSIDPASWNAHDEGIAPGVPWGAAVVGDELRVICGEGPDDVRVIRRFVPGHGFKNEGTITAPDNGTGSHLSFDGDRLYLSQWYNKRIIALDETGRVGTIITLPHEVAGHTIVDGKFYCITTDDENTHVYFLTRVDARNGAPKIDDIAQLNFDARGLAYDGERFWTNHREANETVAFARPDA